MKRFLAIVLTVLLTASALSMTAAAAPADKLISTSTEYLEDGSSIVTSVYESAIQPRTGKKGYKEAVYKAADGTKVFAVTVDGTFEYTYGVSSKATGAAAKVAIYSPKASYVSKNAYTSGASAIATGVVKYNENTVSKTVVLTCDRYGNLS